MKLIVGLGNPGSRYTQTRHNIGRRLIEALAQSYKARWTQSKNLHAQWAEVNEGGIPFLLALPELYMNESGEGVRQLVDHFGIHFQSDLLVVVDDAALPFGKLRLRASGQDGGHRGLRSVEGVLGTQTYARLRMGIAPLKPLEESLEEYVLQPFAADEEKRLGEILERAVESCLLWVNGPIGKAMDRTNKPQP